jgi:hypothetical protein
LLASPVEIEGEGGEKRVVHDTEGSTPTDAAQ